MGTDDFGLDEFVNKEGCRYCGRTNTKLMKPFDLRGFLCFDMASCMQLVRLQRTVRMAGEVSVSPPKTLDLREGSSIPSNREKAVVTQR